MVGWREVRAEIRVEVRVLTRGSGWKRRVWIWGRKNSIVVGGKLGGEGIGGRDRVETVGLWGGGTFVVEG